MPALIFSARPRFALVLTLALALGGCARGAGEDSTRASTDADAAAIGREGSHAVSVVVVRPGFESGDSRHTILEPWVDAPVVARHRGIVRSVLVTEGRRVAKGAVLARLDDDEYRLDLDRATALAQQANAEAARARKAASGNLISQHELEVAEARASAARADEALAKLESDRCTLRAPVAGIVRTARAEPNAVVEEGEVLFHVTETGRLKASVYLSGAEFGGWAEARAAHVSSVSNPGAASATGRVLIANPIADPVTGLHHVEVEVAPGPGLAPGVEVRVDLAARGSKEALTQAVLPRGAYFERSADGLAVYRIASGRANRVIVQLGEGRGDGFPVVSGLLAGDLVLAAGELPPAAGAPVQPKLSSVR